MKYLACSPPARLLPALLLLLLLPLREGLAQTGRCAPATAAADLDASFVRARLYNAGNLFYGQGEEGRYVVPKATGHASLYASSLWIGGMVGGELRVAAATYSDFEFWPGPLGGDGLPANPDDCSAYDRIYKITRLDLTRYAQTGEATDDLRDWPAQLGAPVVDGDGVAGNYDLAAGDRPALLGDEMAWWVMNDAGNVHAASGSAPLGMEVHGTAFAFDPGRYDGSLFDLKAYTTFYRYRLVYRGDAPLTDAYAGLYVDPDLGGASDDFIGSDTTLDLGFVYNAAPTDPLYGVPPALGFAVLRGPDGAGGAPLGMETFVGMLKSGPEGYGEPHEALHFYRSLRGLWIGGAPLREGGYGGAWGTGTGDPTLFHYPGDPADGAYWSEVNSDGEGTANAPGDRRFSLGSGPFTMQPGDEQTFDFAIVWAQGDDHLGSVRKLKSVAADVRMLAASLYSPDPHRLTDSSFHTPQAKELRFVRNHPNPVQGWTTFAYTLPTHGRVRLRVFDVLGREVAVVVDREQGPGDHTARFDASGLPAGVYVARFEVEDLPAGASVSASRPLVVVR